MAAWHVKYDGVCARCGTPLPRGTVAVWERSTKAMHCVECPTAPPGPIEPDPIDIGVPGSSARAEYERRMAKRDADARGKWGDRLGGVVLALTEAPQSTRAWRIGAEGEVRLAHALDSVQDLRILNDRRVPGTRGNIDHILVAPGGIFIVDAKLIRGLVEIRNVGWFFRPDYRLYVGGRDRSKLAGNMEWQVRAVTSALSTRSVDPLPPITPVLCFVDSDWPLFGAPDAFNGVRLEHTGSIKKLVAGPPVLSAEDIERLARILAAALPAK